MAISFDNALHLGAVTATSLTTAFTVGSGSNRLLWVWTFIDNSSVDAMSSVTYATVGCTQAVSQQNTTNAAYQYLHYLAAPTSGANNVVITMSASRNIRGQAFSYAGAAQSGIPDATNTAQNNAVAGGGTSTVSVTTVADNCWVIACTYCQNGSMSINSGVTSRIKFTGASPNDFQEGSDSNAVKTPPGSFSAVWNNLGGGADNFSHIIASFPTFTATTSKNLSLLGVGT